MSMRGELVMRDRKLYVLYSTVDDNAPIRRLLYWRVHDIHRGRGFVGEFLGGGDAVTYAENGIWSAGSKGSVSTGGGHVDAEFVESVPIPPPPARGKELRWHQGRWQRRLASGWADAGEGSATPKKRQSKTGKKTGRELDIEIEEALYGGPKGR
jgi:hypothetical protein